MMACLRVAIWTTDLSRTKRSTNDRNIKFGCACVCVCVCVCTTDPPCSTTSTAGQRS